MPFGYVWKCNHCDNTIRTSELWEFFRDSSGTLKKYGHPGTHSKRAAEAGVKGFYFEGYCPTCRSVHNAVIVEFSEPQPGSLGACLAFENPDIKHQEFDPVCDTCGEKLIDNLENEPCPKCSLGHFEESARFMS